MSEPHDLWSGLWDRLNDGAAQADAPARTLALATQSLNGGGAVRMVVLRGFSKETNELTFYTHTGSNKMAELTANPKAEVLLWDPATSFQARLSVTARCTKGAETLWSTLSPGARLNYLPSFQPGTPIKAPKVPDAEKTTAFTVITARITFADILDLSELPHRRAHFDARHAFTGQWVAP